MMKWLLLGLLVVMINGNNYEQHSYEIVSERGELTYFNPDEFKSFKFYNTKLNRTTRSFSYYFENIVELSTLTTTVQAFAFINNEYRRFPIRFSIDNCNCLEKNYYGLSELLKYGNVTKCPIKPGSYYVKDYVLDYTRFPPNIPERSYKFIINISGISKDHAIMEMYLTVKKIYRWAKRRHQ